MFNNKYLKYIFTADFVVYFLFIANLLMVFFLEYCLLSIPNLNPIISTIGKIVENVGYSIIASVVFFILAVHIPHEMAREGVCNYILRKSNSVAGICFGIHYNCLRQYFPQPLNNDLPFLSDDEIKRIFACLKPNDQAILIGDVKIEATWLQYFLHDIDQSKRIISDIIKISEYIDPILLHILLEIDQCAWFVFLESLKGMNTSQWNDNLSAYSEVFIEYTKLCKNLKDYLKNNGFDSK